MAGSKIRQLAMILCVLLASAAVALTGGWPIFAAGGDTIDVKLDLNQDGVISANVVQHALYTRKAGSGQGPMGIGSFEDGQVTLPFQVNVDGDYQLIVTYALAEPSRLI